MAEKLRRKLLVSQLTSRIYLTKAKPIGDNQWEASADKEDFTEECLRAVLEYFILRSEQMDGSGVKLPIDDQRGREWELIFRPREVKTDGGNAGV